jgi:ribonuclease-3
MLETSLVATQYFPAAIFGHRFTDPTLLEAALTHPSSTDPSQADVRLRYQRLEFLGDAVWSLYVSDALISLLPTASEGELTLRRASLVSAVALAEMARIHGLTPLLVLSKGEECTGGRHKARVLSSAFEAVIGAIYLDGGDVQIRDLAREVCVNTLSGEGLPHDPKTALQQLTQSLLRATPRYRLLRRSGAPHAPTFDVEVVVGRSPMAKGTGRNRREAEREAARDALRSLSTRSATTSSGDNPSDY